MLEEACARPWRASVAGRRCWRRSARCFSRRLLGPLLAVRLLGPVRDDYPQPRTTRLPACGCPSRCSSCSSSRSACCPRVIVGRDRRAHRTRGRRRRAARAPPAAFWHGVTPALCMSPRRSPGGVVLLRLHAPLDRAPAARSRGRRLRRSSTAVEAAAAASRRLTDRLHDGSLPRYAGDHRASLSWRWACGLVSTGGAWGRRPATPLPVSLVPAIGWPDPPGRGRGWHRGCCHRNRLLALVLTGVVGLIVSLAFLQFSAPDLALTQISVEVVTTILLAARAQPAAERDPGESCAARRTRDGGNRDRRGLGAAALDLRAAHDATFATISPTSTSPTPKAAAAATTSSTSSSSTSAASTPSARSSCSASPPS